MQQSKRLAAGAAIGAVVLLVLTGCPPPTPPPKTVPIIADGTNRPEVSEFVEVHVVNVKQHGEGDSWGGPVQEALVAWVSSWQNLEVVDFELVGREGGGDLVILAKRRNK